jgi:hypothetical protein
MQGLLRQFQPIMAWVEIVGGDESELRGVEPVVSG